MARNRINTLIYNNRVKHRIKTREQMVKDGFGGKSGEDLEKEIARSLNLQYALDAEFKRKRAEFHEGMVVIGAKNVRSASDKYAKLDNAETAYKSIMPVFTKIIGMNDVNKHLKKKQTGTQLINNVIEIDGLNYTRMNTKANTSVKSLANTYANFKKVNEFYVLDTETLSGFGKTGYNELDSIQEIAFRKFKKLSDNKIEEVVEDRIETLIGITKEQRDKYMKIFVDNFDKRGWEDINKYKVMAERFAKLGHSDTKIDDLQNGIAIVTKFASDDSKDLMSVSNIKKGIERVYELGKRQNAERLENGLMAWEDMLLRSVKLFDENFVAGYNSVNFDFEKINQEAAKIWQKLNPIQIKEYSKKLGLKDGEIPTIKTKPGMSLDFRDVTRMAAEIMGKTELYSLEQLETIKKMGKTALQQEVLGAIFALNVVATSAHTAGADVTVLANLLAGDAGDGKSLLDVLMETVLEESSDIQGTINKNSILLATQREGFNDYTRKGALNFTYDRSNGIIRTANGYSVGKGGVKYLDTYGKSTGIRNNVAYRIGFMGEMNMNEEFVKTMQGIHQDYAQGKLWAVTFNPIVNKEITGNNSILEDPITYFFTSKEAMEGFISSHFAHVGNTKNGRYYELENEAARNEVKKLFGIHTIKDGKVSEAKVPTIHELIDRGTKQLMNDPAARAIREYEYTKAVNFANIQDYLIGQGANTLQEQRKLLSLATAQEVATKHSLRIRHDVEKILGFTKNGDRQLYSSTLNNVINAYNYLSSQRHITDRVIEEVKGYKNVGTEQRQYLFNSFMNKILEKAEEQYGPVSDELQVYGKDLNYFEFNMPESYFRYRNEKSVPGEIDNVLRVNLNPEKEYSLVDDLIRRRRGDSFIFKQKNLRQAYGKAELINFMKEANAMDEYKGIFDKLLYGEDYAYTKDLISFKKYEKSIIRDELYKNFDEVIDKAVDEDPNVIAARQELIALREKRAGLKKTVRRVETDDPRVKELNRLSDEFKATIELNQNVWESFPREKKDFIKHKQRNIMREQREIIESLRENRPEYKTIVENAEEIAEVENQLDEQYKILFDTLDKSRGKNRREYKELYEKQIKEFKTKQNLDIEELYKSLNETKELVAENIDIDVDALSEKMILAMREAREFNPTIGFSKTRDYSNVMDIYPHKLDDAFITESINETKKALADLRIIDASNKNKIKAQVNQLVDAVLMPTVKDENWNTIKGIDNIVEFAQKTYGYNEETARLLKINLQAQREAHIEGMTNFAEGVIKNGGFVAYNKEGDDLVLVMGGEAFNLFEWARTRFSNGVFSQKTGVNRVVAGTEIDIQNKKIVSNLKAAYEVFKFTDASLSRAADKGDNVARAALRLVSRFASDVRELSAIGSMTTKDTYAWQSLNMENLIHAIPDMMDQIKAYDNWQDDELIDIFERNIKNIRNGFINSEVIEAFTKNKQDFAKMLFGIGAGKSNPGLSREQFVLTQISNYVKDGKLATANVHTGEYDPMALTEFDNHARPPITSADAIMFSKEDVDKKIASNDKLRGRVETGSRLVSKRQLMGRTLDGVGEIENSISFKTANIAERNFKNIISAHFQQKLNSGKISKKEEERLTKIFNQMKGLNLTEQGRILDGYIADTLLSETETQRVGTYKNFIRDLSVNNEEMNKRMKKAMPIFELIEKTNEIVFKPGKESYVKRGEELLTIEGFGGILDPITAKEDAGYFGFEFLSEGTKVAVKESEINRFLNKHKDKIIKADGTIDSDKAMQLLESQFDSSFYVKNAFIKGFNKGTTELAEKGMYEALLSGAGTIDDRIHLLLKEAGFEEAQGKILGNRFINMLEEEVKQEVIEKAGFSSFKEVKEAIIREKFALSDEFRNIKQFEDIMAVALDNTGKHGNVAIAMKQFINNIAMSQLDQELVEQEGYKEALDKAYKETYKIITDKYKIGNEERTLFNELDTDFVDGKILFGRSKDGTKTYIDTEVLAEIEKKYGIYSKDTSNPFAIVHDGEVVGYKSTAMSMFNEDASGTSRSSIEAVRLKAALDDSRRTLKTLEDPSEKHALKKEISNLERQYYAAKRYDKTMKISSREVDMLSLYSYDDDTMANVRSKLVSADEKGGEIYNKVFNRMTKSDGTLNEEYIGKNIYGAFIEDIEEAAYEQALEAKVGFNQGRIAMKFNQSPSAHLEEAVANGFEIAKIEDLVTPHGDRTSFLLDDPNRSFGRNLIIDTGIIGGGDNPDRYVAISAADYKLTGDTIVSDEVQKSISKLKLAKERYTAGVEGAKDVLRDGVTVADLEANVYSAVNEVKSAVVGSMKKTLQGLDTVHLGRYSYTKASMAMIHTDDLLLEKGEVLKKSYHMYNVSKINGKTIGEWAKEGVHYDASWQGRQYFRDLGYYDEKVWKDKFKFKSIEALEKHLAEHGTLGIELRTPTIKEGSTAIVRQFLDVSLKDGQSKGTASLVYARNQDQDGDSVIMAELTHKKTGMTYVDYEAALINAKGDTSQIDADAVKYFEELNAAMTVRASTANARTFENTARKTFEVKEPGMVDSSTIHGVLESEKVDLNAQRRIMPYSQVEADTATRNIMLKRYNEVKGSVLEDLDMSEKQWAKLAPKEQSQYIHDKIATLSDEVQDTLYTAARFVENYQKDMAAAMAKTAGKASIGYINTPLSTMRRYAKNIGMSAEDTHFLQAAADVLEQNIISKKHSTDHTISLAQTFRSYINDMVDGKKTGAIGINTLIREHYAEDIVSSLQTFNVKNYSSYSSDELIEGVTNAINKLAETFINDNKSAKILWKAQDMARNLGVDGSGLEDQLNANTLRSPSIVAKATAKANYGDATSGARPFVDTDGFEKVSRRVVSEGTEAIQAMAVNSSGLAKAALGVAAAVMMTGYIGGNPSVAPGREAEELNQYDSLQDEDLSIQQLPQGGGQGYVININAQSDKGQEHAMQAIQKAMYSSVTTDINISMNINDRTSNISSRFIDSLLSGAL